MPCIKDQSTVDAIALEFTSNGRNKGKALTEVGYSNSYSNEGGRGCDVVFHNVRVIEAIKAIDAKTAVKLEHNRDIAISILTEALVIARAKKDNTGIVQACRELDAISNLHSSTIHNDIEQPQAISAESIDQYRAMAKAALIERAKLKLA